MKFALLLGRILFAAIFIMAVPEHFSPEGVRMASQHGVPMASLLVPLSGLMALAGGLMVLTGFKGRIGAWVLVAFLVPVTMMIHNFWAVWDPDMASVQQMMFTKNLALLGGALFLAYFGTGPMSLDTRLKRRAPGTARAAKPAVAQV